MSLYFGVPLHEGKSASHVKRVGQAFLPVFFLHLYRLIESSAAMDITS
jgi:hypothetical protein